MPERVTIGEERVAITIIHKTHDDLVSSQHSSERWFTSEEEALTALRSAIDALLTGGEGYKEKDRLAAKEEVAAQTEERAEAVEERAAARAERAVVAALREALKDLSE